MENNFQQTVNLREKMERDKEKLLRQSQPAKPAPAAPTITVAEKKAKEIDRVFRDDEEVKNNFQKIKRPDAPRMNEKLIKRVVIAAAVVLVAATSIWLFARKGDGNGQNQNQTMAEPKWYAVELVSGEMYYGLMTDVKANPLELDKVYYDYDQETKKEAATTDTGNIRLVKKGKEAYGPSGKMLIYQAQVKTVDVLADDSKVLNAIKEYEAKK